MHSRTRSGGSETNVRKSLRNKGSNTPLYGTLVGILALLVAAGVFAR